MSKIEVPPNKTRVIIWREGALHTISTKEATESDKIILTQANIVKIPHRQFRVGPGDDSLGDSAGNMHGGETEC